jgi:hypothetical protein
LDNHQTHATNPATTTTTTKYPRLTDQEILDKYCNWLWKMDKMKYTKSLVMCSHCIKFNRANFSPYIVNNRVQSTTSLCPNCAKVNIDFSTSWYFNIQQQELEDDTHVIYVEEEEDNEEDQKEEEEEEV